MLVCHVSSQAGNDCTCCWRPFHRLLHISGVHVLGMSEAGWLEKAFAVMQYERSRIIV